MTIFVRWSDLKSVTVPFELTRETLLSKLAEARARTTRPLHLHVLAGHSWVNPAHNLHVTDAAVRRQLQAGVTPSNLVAEPRISITGASDADIDLILERCREAVRVWGNSSIPEETMRRFAMRADIELLRSDLRANIQFALDDDYLPDDLAELRQFAVRANLGADFDLAYPASALAARGGRATKGVSTPAKRRAARRNAKLGGRPPKK